MRNSNSTLFRTSKLLAHTIKTLRPRLVPFFREERGQATVFFALGLVVIIAFLGLAIDVGSLCYNQHKLHAAAEAAALAGSLEIISCTSATPCSAMQAAAQSALNENGLTGSSLFANCASTLGTGLALTVNNPPCAIGADPNKGKTNYVEAVVSNLVPTYFARIVGYNGVSMSARAEAMRTGNPNCIYALDQSGGNAITVDALSSLTATCGVVDESSATNAFSCNILSGVHVRSVKITGGLQSFLCNATPTPKTNVPLPNPIDPLAWLPKPAVTSCGTSLSSPYTGSAGPLVIAGPAILYPNAAYCGGIVLLPTANVTFMPGTYVIRSGGVLNLQGGLSIDLGSTATGSGVTFYNYGPVGGINFVASSLTLGSVSLVAPTTGTYSGVLFFQDPGNTTPAVIAATSSWNTTVQGAYYFPTATVTCAVTGPALYNILVAKDIAFTLLSFPLGSLSTTSFGNNYSNLANGSPLAGGGSALVQ